MGFKLVFSDSQEVSENSPMSFNGFHEVPGGFRGLWKDKQDSRKNKLEVVEKITKI